MTYSAEVLADAPRGYWRFDGAGGTFADSSGNGRTGTWVSAPTLQVPGLLLGDSNRAADFNGAGNYGNLGVSAWMDAGNVTLEALIRRDAVGVQHVIMSRDIGDFIGTRTRSWQLQVTSGNKAQFVFWAADGGAAQTITGTTNLVAGTTYHIAATYNGAVGRLYVNGVQEAFVNIAGSIPINASNGDFYIGRQLAGGGFMFNGVLDEVAFYGAALSAARILAHYTAATAVAPATPTGLAVTDQGLTTLDVSWAASTGAPTGYRVRLDGGAAVDVGNVLTHQFTGLTPGTTYAVQVQAYNGIGDSAWSASVDGTTDALLAPGALSIVATTATTVSVEWDASVGAEGYEVRADGGDPEDVGDVLEHTFTDLEPGASHTLEVRAYA